MATPISEPYYDQLIGTRMNSRQIVTATLCGLVMFLDGFDTQTVSYMAPHIATEWNLPRTALGPIFSAGLFGLMIGYIVLAPLSDRFGHRRMLITSSVAFGVFTLACVLARQPFELIALRFLTGVGLGAAVPSAIALAGEYSPRRFRASFVLAIYCGFSLGLIVAGIVSGWLIPDYGWRSLFVVGAVFPLLLVPVLVLFLPESMALLLRPGADTDASFGVLRRFNSGLDRGTVAAVIANARPRQERRAPVKRLFGSDLIVGTLLLWFVFVANLGGVYAIQSWMPTIMTDLGHSVPTVVAATSLGTVGGILAVFIIGPMMDRIGACRTLTLFYLVGSVLVALVGLGFSAPLPFLLTAAFFAGFSMSGGQKAVIALAALFYSPEIRSTGVGWALGIGRIGAIGSPLLVGLALGLGMTPQGIFYAMAVPMLLMALAIHTLGRCYPTGWGRAEPGETEGPARHDMGAAE